MSTAQTTSGHCLCGAVSYRISGELQPVVFCHCEQCRRSSGHYFATTACLPTAIRFDLDEGLTWYQSSAEAKRGFCKTCGSSLFWVPEHGRYWCILAGTLDRPTGLTASAHIYVHMASDYYSIDDGLPTFEENYASSFPGMAE